jgi:hypothetical protein
MIPRQALRRTTAAALSALAAFGVQAIEATQWNPQADAAQIVSADALQAPSSWTVGRNEATQFRDGMAGDSMTARASVRSELKQARRQGLMNDTGEAGATERVLAQRETFIEAEHDRLVAMNATPDHSDDAIGALMALTTPGWPMADGTLYALAPDNVELTLPANQEPDEPLPYAASVTPMAPTEEWWRIDTPTS